MAELNLLGTARAVRVALRAAEANVAIKGRKRFERANLELGRLPTARLSAFLQVKTQGCCHRGASATDLTLAPGPAGRSTKPTPDPRASRMSPLQLAV